MMGELYRAGAIRGWSALVTGDFFSRPENVGLVRAAGCHSLFSGVESFDSATLQSYNKRQNTLTPQVEMIRQCLEGGVFFAYGIMLDPAARRLDELRREIDSSWTRRKSACRPSSPCRSRCWARPISIRLCEQV
jgi:hypothetical protein